MTIALSARRARSRICAQAWCAVLMLACSAAVSAATIVVGPAGRTERFAEAVRIARDGDTIEIAPGEYRGDVTVIAHKQLVIRGVGQRPVFSADGNSAEGKAIWVVRGGDITIENIEFRGARVADGNGAGIRFERGRLRLVRCAFFDNEMGLLSANVGDAELQIEDSEFAQAPRHAGSLHHLLYVGRIARFSLTGSRLHQGYIGHLVKSRARESRIAYNLIVDGSDGSASYEIDLPNGGIATVIGNVIGQSAHTENPALVSFGAEGNAWEHSALYLAHNTLINDRPAGATFLHAWPDRLPEHADIQVLNNLTIGPGALAPGVAGRVDGNAVASHEMLRDPAALDFALQPGSALRGRGVMPTIAGGPDLAPTAEFALPVGTRALPAARSWSPGAFQR